MLSLSDYVAMRINQDEIDERNRSKRLENIRICTDYVLEYFTSYIDISPEEELTIREKKKLEILRTNYSKFSYEISEWLVQSYVNNGHRAERIIANAIKEPWFWVFTEESEFRRLSYDVYASTSKKYPYLSSQSEMIYRFLKEYHRISTDDGLARFYDKTGQSVNSEIGSWIDDTLKEYNVDLREFACRYLRWFSKNKARWPAGHSFKTDIAQMPYAYDHENLNNPYNIDWLYNTIPKKKFVRGKKQEIEYLLVYYGAAAHDEEIWQKYLKQAGYEAE